MCHSLAIFLLNDEQIDKASETDLSNVEWLHIYCLPDSVSALYDCTVDIINRRIPSHNLKLQLKDKG